MQTTINNFIRSSLFFLSAILFGLSASAQQDLTVFGSACIGADCSGSEIFDFDTLLLKANQPSIHFNDTSSSANFPTNDWLLGIHSEDANSPANFVIRDISNNSPVLQIAPASTNAIAIGANAQLETGAISVGSPGSERRIMHVADAVDATDAANKKQLDAAQAALEAEVNSKAAALELRLQQITQRLGAL